MDSKKSLGIVAKAAIATGTVLAVHLGSFFGSCFYNMKRMEKHSDKNNMMHAEALGRGKIDIESDIDCAYITGMISSSEIELLGVPASGELTIDMTMCAGRATLVLPAGARVEYEGTGIFEKLIDTRAIREEEPGYKVLIKRRSCFSKIVLLDQTKAE